MADKNNPKMVEGYISPSRISMPERVVRSTVGVTGGLVTSILASYAGYQTAAHDPEIANIVGAVIEKMGHGVGQTITDVTFAVKTLIDNPKIISEINGDSVSRDVIDMGSKLYEYIENGATSAAGNLVRNPTETIISSFGIASIIKFLGSTGLNTLLLRDKSNLDQRIRNRVWNFGRGKNRSRKIEIPDLGGNNFTRK